MLGISICKYGVVSFMKQRGHFTVDADICLYTHTVWKNMHPTSNYRIRDETILYASFNFWISPLKNMIF